MAHMAGDFLQRSRHGTTYYFRRRVPEDVQHILALTQVFRSLATADRRDAIIRARALACRTDELFTQLRKMTTKKDDGSEFKLILKLDTDELGLPRVQMQTEPHDTDEDKQNAFALAQKIAEARQACATVGGQPPTLPPGQPLSEAVEEFLTDAVKKTKTFRTYRTALTKQAIPYFGAETPVSSITQEVFAPWVKKIFKDPTRAHATKQGYVNAFTSLFSWLYASNPKTTPILTTKKLIPPKVDAEDEERDPFSLDQLRVLFQNAARYRAREPYKFWATVATAFMGNRVEELAQVDLRVDLKQIGDVCFLQFNEAADADGVVRKSLKKNKTSKRVVPIHSALVRHGFVDYLRAEAAAGASRPFERGWRAWNDPERGTPHWAHYASKWGSRELHKLHEAGKLDRSGLKLAYFHSMRHTFAQVLAERNVNEERRAALQGQKYKDAGENASRYVTLRKNPRLLSAIVEEHLTDYVAILDDVMADA